MVVSTSRQREVLTIITDLDALHGRFNTIEIGGVCGISVGVVDELFEEISSVTFRKVSLNSYDGIQSIIDLD